MNNALEVLKREFKPYRLTKKKNVTIIDSTSGTFVVKEKQDNKVANAYEYLKSRNFDYFPPLALNDRGDVNVFEYIEDVKMPKEQKAMDFIVKSNEMKKRYILCRLRPTAWRNR